MTTQKARVSVQGSELMKVYLSEITEQETRLAFTESAEWISQAVANVDEKLDELSPSHPPILTSPPRLVPKRAPQTSAPPSHTKRPIEATFMFRKVDETYLVSGQLKTEIMLLCSRCATPFAFKCSTDFSSLFCKDPTLAGVSLTPLGQNHGTARHAHEPEADYKSSTQDMDISYSSNDYVDLSDVVTEQLHLQVPFQPLCQETCKGICHHCGTDLNFGRCACAKLVSSDPFAVLGNVKIKL